MFKVTSFHFLLITTAFALTFSAQASAQYGNLKKVPPSSQSAAAVDPEALGRAALPDSDDSGDKGLIGSWLVNVTSGSGSQFKSLGTFGVDGTYTGADQGDICCGTNNTAQHGAWKRIKNNQFALTFVELVYDPNTGELLGTIKVQTNIQLTNAGWHGNYTLHSYDAEGHIVDTDTGTVTARRICA